MGFPGEEDLMLKRKLRSRLRNRAEWTVRRVSTALVWQSIEQYLQILHLFGTFLLQRDSNC